MKELKDGRTVRVRELGPADLGRGDGAQQRTKRALGVLRLAQE